MCAQKLMVDCLLLPVCWLHGTKQKIHKKTLHMLFKELWYAFMVLTSNEMLDHCLDITV